ncbi:MAG TPA: hypothetical protein VIL33_02950, partial [Rhodothermia bacterium]
KGRSPPPSAQQGRWLLQRKQDHLRPRGHPRRRGANGVIVIELRLLLTTRLRTPSLALGALRRASSPAFSRPPSSPAAAGFPSSLLLQLPVYAAAAASPGGCRAGSRGGGQFVAPHRAVPLPEGAG